MDTENDAMHDVYCAGEICYNCALEIAGEVHELELSAEQTIKLCRECFELFR